MNEKRLKKKRKSSSDEDEEFGEVLFSKSISAPVKKSTLIKKVKQQRNPPPTLKEESPPKSRQMEVEDPNTKKIVLEPFNKDKLFYEILTQANNPQFLTILRNLLSGCKHTLDSKKKQFKKKWTQLRNSSCSRDEYIRKEQDVKKTEEEQTREIKQDVISRLGYSKTKGFESREQLVDAFKEANPGYKNYEFDENEYYKRKLQQFQLLEMLMKQPDLVLLPSPNNIMRQFNYAPKLKIEESLKENRGDVETDEILNKFDVEQNPTVQFLFMKQFSNINYDRIFENDESCFKVKESEQFMMSKKSISWLLDSKSDEIYSNQKFQVETFEKYSTMLKGILDNTTSLESVTEKTREQLVEVCTYILNSVHYSQKFKLRCPILHPLDILFVIEKIRGGKS